MVRKRNRLLTHILLIILVIVVLFPIVWVVSTSFRRDEAAFSPKLFSSRLTLQHYKDLVAPEKNLPVLIQEMQSLVSRVEPFKDVTREKAEKLIEDRISRFDGYLNETRKLLEDSYRRYTKTEETFSERVEEVKAHTESVLEKIENAVKKELEKTPVPQPQELAIALYEKLKGKNLKSSEFSALKDELERLVGYSVNTQDDLKNALSDMELIYQKEIGSVRENIEKLQSEISSVQEKISQLEKQKAVIEEEILDKQKVLEILKPDIDFATEILADLSEMLRSISKSQIETMFTPDDSAVKDSIEKAISELSILHEKISSFSDLKDLAGSVAKMKESLLEMKELLLQDGNITKKSLYRNFLQSFEEVIPTVDGVLKQMSENIDSFIQKAKELKDLQNELAFLNSRLEGLKKSLTTLTNTASQKESRISLAKRYVDLRVFSYEIENRKRVVEDIKSFNSATQIKLLSIYRTSKNFVSLYISQYGNDSFIQTIRKMVSELSWIEDYREFSRRMETGYKNALDILENSRKVLYDFKGSYPNLLDLSYRGVFVSSEHLQMLYDLVKMNFVQEVLTNTAVASRKAGSLMDSVPLKELRSDFKKIDGDLYRVAQIWEQKTRHYFLRWVANSVVVAGLVSIITTAVCALAAYPFSRMRFWGRQYGIMALLLIQMFPAIMYMVAIYGLLKLIGQFLPFLGLDSLGGLIFAYLGNIAYNMYLIKGFYDTIPSSLEEAAMIDGATRFQTFYKIVVPLALPILSVIVILTFIGTFNEFVLARIILQDVKNYTYALGLWTFSTGAYETEWGLFTAAALLGMTPMVILFLSLQKYIVGGLTKGSVKG
ncbi:Maltose ABC transporter, permease protein [Thermotoga neapolitana LA10]|uniref:Maltose ABC transporter, permease protein n=2 Tax=Thermotoga neapolitana TaxID=2337 RepID=B9K7K6_THENN|nr:ABC transporter permease subunit [Thermotoga neapolitana]ACM22939.1 Maltose ABC transporter, permease protein [Thermotoga neapolitana DSM 4359]KFZ21982.1 Maltose ABC transporter, permease protein [Thermotoga neapolitana LA10]MDK2786419.1 maltose/maltodextrin transport system permease protein [Thermotoga sp.]